jgi:hypothetical protein
MSGRCGREIPVRPITSANADQTEAGVAVMDVGEAFQQRIGGLLRLVELAGVDCERTLRRDRRYSRHAVGAVPSTMATSAIPITTAAISRSKVGSIVPRSTIREGMAKCLGVIVAATSLSAFPSPPPPSLRNRRDFRG